MIRQIIFYISIEDVEKDTDTGVLFFEWNGKLDVMKPAFEKLEEYMNEKFPKKDYTVKDWEWVDRR